MVKAKEVAIKVIARFRPINVREMEESKSKGWSDNQLRPCIVSEDRKSVTIHYGGKKPAQFTLDYFLGETTKQTYAFEVVALPTVMDCLQGINGCVFAYGQTGSGKTFSMFGPEVPIDEQETMVELLGMIPQASMIIFEYLASDKAAEVAEWRCELSVMEIYVKNTLRDLLHPRKKGDKPLKLRDGARGVVVQGLKSISVKTLADVLNAIAIANMSRTTSATKMNATSSRSHSVFTLKLKIWLQSGTKRVSTLNFCDLAGSEKIGKTGAKGKQASEGMAINMSLTCLGRVINALVTHRDPPFRDSALTHVLKDSLQGNCKTTILVCLSPHKFNVNETVNSLRFATRAKLIKNKVKANKVLSRQELHKLINELKAEIKILTDKLGGKVIDTFEKRTVFIKFCWSDKRIKDLPNGSQGTKVWINGAIKTIGNTHNLKSLKISHGIRDEDNKLVIMIMLHKNEYWNYEQIVTARDLIHRELKGMKTGLFVDANEDSVGDLSGSEQAYLDNRTMNLMIRDLKASKKQHLEDAALIKKQDEELEAIRIENDQLKFGIEQLDELAYAYDLEMERMTQRLQEREEQILELQVQLGMTWIPGDESYDDAEDSKDFENETENLMNQTLPFVKMAREGRWSDAAQRESLKEIHIPKEQTDDSIVSPPSLDFLGEIIPEVEVLSTPKERTRHRSNTEPCVPKYDSLSFNEFRKSGQVRLSPSVRYLLGTGSALPSDVKKLPSIFFNSNPEDTCVEPYSEEDVSKLCGLFRSVFKKIWGAGTSLHSHSTTNLDVKDARIMEEKNQLLKVSGKLMEQLGAIRREADELRQELTRSQEEKTTWKQSAEAMALELDKYKSAMNSVSLFENTIETRAEKSFLGEDYSVFTAERLENAPDIRDLLVAQQRQLVNFNRKNVCFSQLPRINDEWKSDTSDSMLLTSSGKNIVEYNVDEVYNWMVMFDQGSYGVWATEMKNHKVDGKSLVALTPPELITKYKMPPEKVYRLVNEIRRKMEKVSVSLLPLSTLEEGIPVNNSREHFSGSLESKNSFLSISNLESQV